MNLMYTTTNINNSNNKFLLVIIIGLLALLDAWTYGRYFCWVPIHQEPI